MITQYIKIAIRNIKNKFIINCLNVFGLAIGLAAFLILGYYIEKETSFDKFHKDAKQIYRVESSFTPSLSKNDVLATSSFGYGPTMKNEMPEVLDYCRINIYTHEKDVKYQDKVYREQFVVPVDSNFFSFFSFPLIEGNPQQVLNKPNTIVISESASKKYFNSENPIGKILEVKSISQSLKYTVTGICKDLPENSHFRSDFFLSYPYNNNFLNNSWYMHEAYLYVKVNSENDKNAIVDKFPIMAEKYKTKAASKDKKWKVDLIPLASIHLQEPKAYELENKGNKKSIYFLMLIAIIVLLIGWINYVNISTTYALERSGEISIRKVNGARFKEICKQFLIEALILNLIALLLALLLIMLFLPVVQNKLIGSSLAGIWTSHIFLYGSSIAILLGIIITGYAPALLLSKVKSASILRNQSTFRGGNKKLREGLVVFQFVISIFLIVGTLTVKKQLSFMMNQDLGINIDRTLVFKTPTKTSGYNQKIKTLQNELEKTSGVGSVSISSVVPGKAVGHLLSNKRVDKFSKETKLCEMLRVDSNFLPLYDLEILAGRNFVEENESDKDGLILTETAARLFGFFDYHESINRQIILEGIEKKSHILGIIKDYHHISVKENYRPIILFMSREHGWIKKNYVSIKIAGNRVGETTKEIEQQYSKLFTEASFEYFFMDSFFNTQYQNDKKFAKLFVVFTWLGIFIVCLGILGLSGFILIKRKKEIGIRKINGASTSLIIFSLSKGLIKWNLVAFAIAVPIAYVTMNHWLQTFPVRTTMDWQIFGMAGFMALGIALLTVSWQSWIAASRNPVEALRYE